MTTNIGTEYINIKKAQYNRSVRAASGMSARVAEYAPARTDMSYSRTKRISAPVNADAREKSLAKEVSEELGRAITKARKAKARERALAPVYSKKYVRAREAFPVSVIGYIVIFSVIAMFLVLGNSKINEATLYADALKGEISAEENRAEILNSSLNKRNDASYIENYATNVLGMVKSGEVAKRYVSISGEEKTVVSGRETYSGANTSASLALNAVN